MGVEGWGGGLGGCVFVVVERVGGRRDRKGGGKGVWRRDRERGVESV